MDVAIRKPMMEGKIPAFAYVTQEISTDGIAGNKSSKVSFSIDYADTESIQGLYYRGAQKFDAFQIWTRNEQHMLASVHTAMLAVHRDIFASSTSHGVPYQDEEGYADADLGRQTPTYYAPIMLCVLNGKVTTDFEQTTKQLNDWCYEWGGLVIKFVFTDMVDPGHYRLFVHQRVTPQSILSKARDGVTGLVRRVRGRDAYLN